MEQINPNWKKKAVLFLVSQGITLFGSTLVQMALVWFVTLKTSSGAWVTALTLCAFLPQLLISPIAGVWADRLNKKLLIILSDAGIALFTLALAFLLPRLSADTPMLAAILIISALRSLGAGIQTPAVNAMIPVLVPEPQLMRFNGVNSALQSVIQFAAPAAAAALLNFGALSGTLFIDVATAAVGIGLLSCIALPAGKPAEGEKPTVLADIKEGLRYCVSQRFIGVLLLIYGVFIFLSIPSGFLSALLVTRTFGDNYLYLSIAEMVGFAGMTAGGLLLGLWGGFKNRCRTLLLGLAAYGVFSIALGLLKSFPLFACAMLLMCLAIPIVQTAVTTLIQERAEPEKQGRVFSLLGAMYSGFLPLGMALFGPAADLVSLQFLMLVTGGLLLLLAVGLRLARRFFIAGQSAETPTE